MTQLNFKCIPIITLFLLNSTNVLPKGERLPNIIVILTDDLGYGDLGCYGSCDIRTPNIDGLALSGVKYTSGYVAAPQCSPSRAGLMMGISPSVFGYLDIDPTGHRGLPEKHVAPTMAEMLKERGYITGMIGKWHLGHEPKEIGASWPDAPWLRGFDYTLMHGGGLSRYFPYREEDQRAMNIDARLREVSEGKRIVEPCDFPTDSYITDLFSDAGLRFIERHQQSPFFLYLSYNAPHFPMQAKEADLEANSHIPEGGRRVFAGMMTAVDRGIGQLLEKLESLGIRDETLIVFLSDNGAPGHNSAGYNYSFNTPFQGQKGSLLDGGIRVPFIISFPKMISPGQTNDQVALSTDLFATFGQLVGGKLDGSLPYSGISLIPTWTGRTPDRGPVCWVWRTNGAVRDGKLKYITAWEGDDYWETSYNDVGLYRYDDNDILERRVRNENIIKKHEEELGNKLVEWRKKHQDQL